MKNRVIFAVVGILLLLISGVSALSLEVKVQPKSGIVIPEVNEPAVYDMTLKNNGDADSFEIYSLIGASLTPKDPFFLASGQEKVVEVKAYPNEHLLLQRGQYSFEYQIKGETSGVQKGSLTLKIVPLAELVEISFNEVNKSSSKTSAVVRNVHGYDLRDISLKFKSPFFEETKNIDFIGAFESKSIELPVKITDEKLNAGPYVVGSVLTKSKKSAEISGVVQYRAKEEVLTDSKKEGFAIQKVTISKTNSGNTAVSASIELRRTIFTRLFSVSSIEPTDSSLNWFYVDYTWERTLRPGEKLEVSMSTNYILPFVVLVLIIVTAYFVKKFYETDVSVKKKAIYVKTKGVEFALKIVLIARSRKAVEGVVLHDRIPHMAKLYEKFGRMPDKVDEQTRRISWNLGPMASGEERVVSYIIYSKVTTLGRFELPIAEASFSMNGQRKTAGSNRAYFVSDNK